MSIIIGIDPGLINSAWTVINQKDNKMQYVDSGTIVTKSSQDMASRLSKIYHSLSDVITLHGPEECSIEETFVNKNPSLSLKLGQARGAAILAASNRGINVTEYSPRLIKKSVVGSGKADKIQVEAMIKYLMPTANIKTNHEADAAAAAICHANILATQNKLKNSL